MHIPFCSHKCAYCNFYSAVLTESLKKDYLAALEKEIGAWGQKLSRRVDSVYIGGGTPSVLGEDIKRLIDCIKGKMDVCPDAEITVEMNPSAENEVFLDAAFSAGVNRLSIGAQSSDDRMLGILGRTHTAAETVEAVKKARAAGFENISLDVMIGLPESTLDSVKRDIDFILSASPEHISAYILKIEEKTAFYKAADSLSLPDDDAAAEQYLYLCSRLQADGYEHYEISNFCKDGRQSSHNLKYWNCEEYLGIGPAAHSFIAGRRFYYSADLKEFINSSKMVDDGAGGDKSEKFMLMLRLAKGVQLGDFFCEVPQQLEAKIHLLCKAGLIKRWGNRIALTDKGMAVSNSIITELDI